MAPEDDHPQSRRPSRVKGKNKKTIKQPKGPWYRHTTWFIPTVACVVFAVLIGAGFGVRQIIIVLRKPAEVTEVTDNEAITNTETLSPLTEEDRGGSETDSSFAPWFKPS